MDFTFLNMTLHDGHGGTYKLKLNKTAGTRMDQDPANNEISSVTMGGNCSSSGAGLTCSGGGLERPLRSQQGLKWCEILDQMGVAGGDDNEIKRMRRRQSVLRPAVGGAMLTLLRLPC